MISEIEYGEKKFVENVDSFATLQDVKILSKKKILKTYKVTVSYIKISEEETELKRAIINRIIRKRR
jgi:hypothetical protein